MDNFTKIYLQMFQNDIILEATNINKRIKIKGEPCEIGRSKDFFKGYYKTISEICKEFKKRCSSKSNNIKRFKRK